MSEIQPNTPNPVREDAYVEELAEKLGIDPQYIPKSPVWRNEEEIKAIAEMLANMSGGGSSGGGVLVVHGSDAENPVLDKTWKEINDAFEAGQIVILIHAIGAIEYLANQPYADAGDNYYSVSFFGDQSFEQYSATTENGYPVVETA